MSELNYEITCQEDCYMVCNQGNYFKLGIWEGNILKKLKDGMNQQTIAKEENMTVEKIDELLSSLEEMGVIGEKEKGKEKKNIFFYKIPLFSPDKGLEKMTAWMKKNQSIVRTVFWLCNLIILGGLVLLFANAKEIFTIGSLKLSIGQYILLYAIFFLTVVLHEFSHGIVCRYIGGKVGKIGFMFIFFAPAMYCDISGVRMVKSRKKKIMAASAGFYANILVMAGAAILFGMKPSPLLAAFIILNFTTIISNAIPFIRLDGYWILSFATEISNLYEKSVKGAKKVFACKNWEERFIAVYGIITYLFIAVSLYSAGLSLISAVKWIIK